MISPPRRVLKACDAGFAALVEFIASRGFFFQASQVVRKVKLKGLHLTIERLSNKTRQGNTRTLNVRELLCSSERRMIQAAVAYGK